MMELDLSINSKLWNFAVYLATVFTLDLSFHSPTFYSETEGRPRYGVSLIHFLSLTEL